MGMDLFSVRKDRKSKDNLYFRFNWHGWGKVCDFLEELDCDLSEFKGTNDADIVSPESCRDIAQKVKAAWDTGKLMEYWEIKPLETWSSATPKTRLHHLGLARVGVLNGESGSYWVADHKNSVIIPPSKNPYPRSLNYVLKCRLNRLPLVMGVIKKEMTDRHLTEQSAVLDMAILEARLRGETYDPARLIKLRPDLDKYDADSNPWSTLGYYMAFGRWYCERCSHLGGFKQC